MSIEELEIANPFVETVDSEYFVGREAEIATFKSNLQGIRKGLPMHQFVAGLHGTGKTFYLHKLVEVAAQQGFIALCVVLDAQLSAYDQIKVVLQVVVSSVQGQLLTPIAPSGRNLLDEWRAGKESSVFQFQRSDDLISEALKADFATLGDLVKSAGRNGIVLCIDEGQRIEPIALSALKNALQALKTFMVVLSLRLSSDARGIEVEGRTLLEERATIAEGDIGAARFFGTGTAMGPFSSNQEVLDFFEKRIAGHKISFSTDTQIEIGSITDRMPREMVRLASHLYSRAMKDGIVTVGATDLKESFADMHGTEMRTATGIVSEMSRDMSDVLKSLCLLEKQATAQEVSRHAYPDTQDAKRSVLTTGVQQILERLSNATSMVRKGDEKYWISDSVHRYALKQALRAI